MIARRPSCLALSFATLAAFAFPISGARADNIDEKLMEEAPKIVKVLQEHHYRNVGVLRFKLQKGKDSHPSFNGGPINSNLATRLEVALLAKNDLKDPLGIIHDASAHAASQAPNAHWSSSDAKARTPFFECTYPLGWEAKPVQADVLLSGIVLLSDNMKNVTVGIYAFTPKQEKSECVCEFKVDTDRSILSDAGQSWVISRGARSEFRRRSVDVKDADAYKTLMDDLDKDAAASAARRDKEGADLSNEMIEFRVDYDKKTQELSEDPAEKGELRIPTPKVGQEIRFQLKNKTSDDLAVVVKVNGKSTMDEDTAEPEACRKWILPADDVLYTIEGFYDEKDVKSPFVVVTKEDDLVKNEMAEKLGVIEVFVFQKGRADLKNEILFSTRKLSLRGPTTAKERAGTLAKNPEEAQKRALQLSENRKRQFPPLSRGIVVKDTSKQTVDTIERRDFANAVQIGNPIVIRYFDPKTDD